MDLYTYSCVYDLIKVSKHKDTYLINDIFNLIQLGEEIKHDNCKKILSDSNYNSTILYDFLTNINKKTKIKNQSKEKILLESALNNDKILKCNQYDESNLLVYLNSGYDFKTNGIGNQKIFNSKSQEIHKYIFNNNIHNDINIKNVIIVTTLDYCRKINLNENSETFLYTEDNHKSNIDVITKFVNNLIKILPNDISINFISSENIDVNFLTLIKAKHIIVYKREFSNLIKKLNVSYNKNITERKETHTYSSIYDQIIVLEANEIYRMGDVIKLTTSVNIREHSKEVFKILLNEEKYKKSILNRFLINFRLRNGKPNKGVILLASALYCDQELKTKTYDDNYLVIHLRSGDNFKNFGLGSKVVFDSLINQTIGYTKNKKSIKNVVIVTALHYGHNPNSTIYKHKNWSYNKQNHIDNINSMLSFVKKLEDVLENDVKISFVSSKNIDIDFLTIIKAKNLIVTKGGFSILLRDINRLYNTMVKNKSTL
tara:strand:- start:563 stop:2020 length:1458 start_codon:yes stop_codon:yes gene_type:complete